MVDQSSVCSGFNSLILSMKSLFSAQPTQGSSHVLSIFFRSLTRILFKSTPSRLIGFSVEIQRVVITVIVHGQCVNKFSSN